MIENFLALRKAAQFLSLAFLTSTLSFGAVIYDSVISLNSTDPVQLGRISRNGVPTDWSTGPVFPGVINPTTSYRYETFALPLSPFPYLQITVDDISGTSYDFVSAYLNSFNPNPTAANRGLDVNYLGDPGRSGNFFGTVPVAFQITVNSPLTNRVLLSLIDATGTTNGIGVPLRITVEGFYDTTFNDTNPVPEPASLGLSAAALAVGTFFAHRRKRNTNS